MVEVHGPESIRIAYWLCSLNQAGSTNVRMMTCGNMGDTAPLAPWHPGTLTPWHPGTLTPWHPGTLAPWHPGTLVPWHPGAAVSCVMNTGNT